MRKTNEARQTRLVNPFVVTFSSHFVNGTSYKLARQRANDRIRRANQQGGPKEGVSPVSLLYSLVAIVTML